MLPITHTLALTLTASNFAGTCGTKRTSLQDGEKPDIQMAVLNKLVTFVA
jgi:hypothetical protein